MVIHTRMLISTAVVLLAGLSGTTCKVVNEDHCANQAVPGNEFCVELNTATPYCSPCRRQYHGCVDFEPFACEGYTQEIGESLDGPSEPESTSDEPESTSLAPASTGEASTSDEPGSSSGGEGSSGTAGSSG